MESLNSSKNISFEFDQDFKIISDLYNYSKTIHEKDILSITIKKLNDLLIQFKKKNRLYSCEIYDSETIQIENFIQIKKLEIAEEIVNTKYENIFQINEKENLNLNEEKVSLLGNKILIDLEKDERLKNKDLKKIGKKFLNINQAMVHLNAIVKNGNKNILDLENKMCGNVENRILKANKELKKLEIKKNIINKKKFYFIFFTVFLILIFGIMILYDFFENGKKIYYRIFFNK